MKLFKSKCQICKSTKNLWYCDIRNLKLPRNKQRNLLCETCLDKKRKDGQVIEP